MTPTSGQHDVLRAAGALLADLGFHRHSDGIFTGELSEDVIGWIGLTTVAYPHGVTHVGPLVGMRHQQVARLVAECCEEQYHPYMPPSMSQQLGYLMPEGRYITWSHGEPGAIRDLADMARQVSTYALPHMRHFTPLSMLCAYFEGRKGLSDQLLYWRPVAWYLAGDAARAMAIVQERLEAVREEPPPWRSEYETFAMNFLGRIRSASSPEEAT